MKASTTCWARAVAFRFALATGLTGMAGAGPFWFVPCRMIVTRYGDRGNTVVGDRVGVVGDKKTVRWSGWRRETGGVGGPHADEESWPSLLKELQRAGMGYVRKRIKKFREKRKT